MAAGEPAGATVRFGRTLVQAAEGELAQQHAEALIVPANMRGVMGTGQSGGVRLAGGVEIERQAMAGAPLTLGGAIITDAGALAERGVRAVIHAVVSEQLGQPVRPDIVRRVIPAALRLVDDQRLHTVVLPVMGGGADQDETSALQIASAIVEEIVAYLRRVSSRIEWITIVSRSAHDVAIVTDMLHLAREHAWGPPR